LGYETVDHSTSLPAIMLAFTISCKKETIKAKEGIQGVWELRKTSGSWLKQTYQTGSGNRYKFYRNCLSNKGKRPGSREAANLKLLLTLL
jgi:hypothetical protein